MPRSRVYHNEFANELSIAISLKDLSTGDWKFLALSLMDKLVREMNENGKIAQQDLTGWYRVAHAGYEQIKQDRESEKK